MRIISNDISIIVQGAVSNITGTVLKRLREVFPRAEIVLSTWEGTELNGLIFDKVILSKDPGAQPCDEISNVMNNVNRQIVSTAAGINAASKQFVLKTRTDIYFDDCGFLEYFGKYDDNPPYAFRNRILVCNYYTRNPRVMPLCFHPSDWILFGNASDLKTYFGGLPLQSKEDSEWFGNRSKTHTLYTNYLPRFTPEQHIFLGFLRHFFEINISCYYDTNKELILLTEEMFAKCFVVLNYNEQLKIKFLKYNPNRYMEKYSLVSHKQWIAMYEKYRKNALSVRWAMYLVRAWILRCLIVIRRICVIFLNALGIKEQIKSFLGKMK